DVDQQSEPDERQRDRVGQQLRVEVDEARRDQAPEVDHRGEGREAEAQAGGTIRGAGGGEELDQRVTRADARAALQAATAQESIGEERDVLQGTDPVSARRTG